MMFFPYRPGVPAVVCLCVLAVPLPAQQVPSMLDSQRSLQIPPQDILRTCSEPKTAADETSAPAVRPASRPAAQAAESQPAISRANRQAATTRPAGLSIESVDRESRPLARAGLPERVAAGSIRGSELKDVPRSRRSSSLWSFGDLWPLLSVVALIAVMAWILKKAMASRRGLAAAGVIEVLSRTSLSSKQSLVLVKMGRRLLLLGVTGDEMHTLCIVEDPDQVAMLVGEAASGLPGSMTQVFAREFAEESRAYETDAEGEMDETVVAGEPVRSLLDRIRHLTSRRNVA